ncbi:hypothetical protein CLV40_112226 [Actinokineospora auranticolor]|uniref:Uncharacterized protein n=1 Tax=Actinokineospora auranticolor TaxID=155976 RepID=A0A2S6GL48_9PSEU|nr:hypothetical protein CLV40_112226 [Actinokineospora auranticolor]
MVRGYVDKCDLRKCGARRGLWMDFICVGERAG